MRRSIRDDCGRNNWSQSRNGHILLRWRILELLSAATLPGFSGQDVPDSFGDSQRWAIQVNNHFLSKRKNSLTWIRCLVRQGEHIQTSLLKREDTKLLLAE